MLGALRHDPTRTLQLVQRLIDAGADVNARSNRGDGVLDSLLILPHGDEDWVPLYDVIFPLSTAAFVAPNRAGFTPLARAQNLRGVKPELLRRIEEAIQLKGSS